ncbi:MAG: hypothetical protein DLM72_00635, partial [Candidatus Nitrosopolaris wilkensis]
LLCYKLTDTLSFIGYKAVTYTRLVTKDEDEIIGGEWVMILIHLSVGPKDKKFIVINLTKYILKIKESNQI